MNSVPCLGTFTCLLWTILAARPNISLDPLSTWVLTSLHRQGRGEVLRRNQGMSPRPRDCFPRSGSHSLQGKVYDVTGNKMYQPGNSYNGKPTPRAMCSPGLLPMFLLALPTS